MAMTLRIGDTVRVIGVTARASRHFNGLIGRIVGEFVPFDGSASRWRVELFSGDNPGAGSTVTLRGHNLQKTSAPTGRPGGDYVASGSRSRALAVGDRVRVLGLTSAEALHFNGMEGTLRTHYRLQNRWEVELASGDARAIKAENLELIAETMADDTQGGGRRANSSTRPRRLPEDFVLYQYDYRPEDLGVLFAMIPRLGIDGAAGAVFASNELDSMPKKTHFIKWALDNPAMCRQLVSDRMAGTGAHLASWIEDIVLMARQAAWYRHLHWLAPTAQAWGHGVATASLRAFDELGRRVRAEPAGRTLPYVFEKASSGRTLLMWQPTEFLDNASRCPRPRDQTYAAFRFQETVCDEVFYLGQMVRQNEPQGVAIRVEQVWTAITLKLWIQQSAQAHSTRPVTDVEYCAIIRGVFTMLGTNSQRTAAAESLEERRPGGGEASRHGPSGSPGGGRRDADTRRRPQPEDPRFVFVTPPNGMTSVG